MSPFGRICFGTFSKHLVQANPRLRSPSQMKNTELPGIISRIARKNACQSSWWVASYHRDPEKLLDTWIVSWSQLGQLVGFTGMKYCCWFGNPVNSPVESHDLQGFIHPRWLFGISSINSITFTTRSTLLYPLKETARNI